MTVLKLALAPGQSVCDANASAVTGTFTVKLALLLTALPQTPLTTTL